ncbi:hypothetical protein NDU88_001782 [Pleurodeles waltl]|uniref:Uncharacterized protein n=1 Tax=Pleurodeles waltl TaxID=8319 RepID=A0AAV7WND4_PLEWA|nr:hypothetical protein NDU88_001782 [Pleurodeles waltl]
MESLEESGAAVGGADGQVPWPGLPRGTRDQGVADCAETLAVHMCATELGDRLGAAAEQWGAVRSPRLRLERRWLRGPANTRRAPGTPGAIADAASRVGASRTGAALAGDALCHPVRG